MRSEWRNINPGSAADRTPRSVGVLAGEGQPGGNDFTVDPVREILRLHVVSPASRELVGKLLDSVDAAHQFFEVRDDSHD
jgi:hypothetical protein